MVTKTCRVCGVALDTSRKGRICKTCHNQQEKERRARDPEKQREVDRQFRARRRAEQRSPTTDAKICSQCGEEKLNEEFPKNKLSADGLDYRCRACKALYTQKYNAWRWAKKLHNSAKLAAKARGHEVSITEQDTEALWEEQGGKCYWLGVPLIRSATAGRHLQRPSIDRLDCSRGYSRDNVVLTCQFANMGRCDMDADTFRRFINETLRSWLGDISMFGNSVEEQADE